MRNRNRQSPAALILPLCIGLFFFISSFFAPVLAATTDTISFQSKLVNSDGTNIANGTYEFRFRMFATSSGGAALWSEDKSIGVVDGVVSTQLGSSTSFGSNLFDNGDLYLQVCFDANGGTGDSVDTNCDTVAHRYEEVFSTRKPVTAVPVALRAKFLTDSNGNSFGPNSFFRQNGNAFAGTAVLGTTDNNGISIITNGTQRVEVSAVGNTSFSGQLVLGSYAVNPTGVAAGAMIFNTTSNRNQCFSGTSWSDCSAPVLLTVSDTALADGSYINLAHGLNTNDILASGWVNSESIWKQLDGTYTPAIAWKGKDTARDNYYQAANFYSSTAETALYMKNIVSQGLFFDTFEDKTKTDYANTTLSMATGMLDSGFASSITSNHRGQKGRVGLWGNLTMNSTSTDTEGRNHLGSASQGGIFYYERGRTDSTSQTLVDLGIDPNWFNGVTLISMGNQQNFPIKQSKNLTLSYNGSLVKATGRYASNARSIRITIVSPTTFDWTDNNGNSGAGVTMTFGVAQALGSTGVSLTFTNTAYNVGDVFQVASWYTEPTSAKRGSKQEFPERAHIIASADALDIVDADTQKLWMGFVQGTNYAIGPTGGSLYDVEFLNGRLYTGANSTYDGLFSIDFALDQVSNTTFTDYRISSSPISVRNAANTFNFISTDRKLPSPYGSVQALDAKVMPNQPTQQVTQRGWGFIYVNLGAAGTTGEYIRYQYPFVSTPNVRMTYMGYSGSAPNTLSDCSAVHAVSTLITAVVPNVSSVYAGFESDAAYGPAYACYTWEATGVVAPRQVVAVGTGSGVSLISENAQPVAQNNGPYLPTTTSVQISTSGSSNLALTSNGALYYDYLIPLPTPYYQLFSYHLAANPSPGSYAYNDWFGDRYYTSTHTITHVVGSSSYPQGMYATENTSTLSSEGNTIYIPNSSGVSVIQEYWDGSYNESIQRATSSVKYYTKDYISEELYGSYHAMLPFNGSGSVNNGSSIADIGYSAYTGTATNTNGSGMAYVSGVRGTGISFDGIDDLVDIGSYSRYWAVDRKFISVWVKPTAAGNAVTNIWEGKGIVAETAGNAGIIQANYPTGGGDKMYAYNYSGGSQVVGVPYTVGEWMHLAMVHFQGVLFLYKNGVLVGSTASGNNGMSGTIQIGKGWGARFQGVIDEPFVGYTPRTPAQIKNMYETGLRALKSHDTNLGGGSADANQKLGGSTTSAIEVEVDTAGQYMYVANGGVVSKVQLNSDTTIKNYTTTANVPAGGPILSASPSMLEVGDTLELVGSASGVKIMGPDDNATANTANYESKTYTLPKSIASAVIWVNSQLDSSDAGNTLTVKASVNGGSSYATCTLVGTDTTKVPSEKEYACSFASSGSSLKIKLEFARTNEKTSTFVTQYGVTWLGQSGFRIEQTDANNIRLYNYTGESQNVRLNVTGSGASGGGGGDTLWVDGGSYIYTLDNKPIRIYDSDGSNYFGIAHDGTNMQFSQDGTTVSYFDANGNFLPGTTNTYTLGSDDMRWQDLYLSSSSLHIGESLTDEGYISYNTSTNVLGINTDSTTNGDIAFNSDNLYLDKSTGSVGIGTTSPLAKLFVDATATPTGPELVTNGTFTGSATGWTLGDCASYGSNQVTVTHTACNSPQLTTNVAMEAGKRYLITFTVSGVTDGEYVAATFDENTGGYYGFGNGTHTVAVDATWSGTDTLFITSFIGLEDASWTIDDISVRETTSAFPAFAVTGYDGSNALSIGGVMGNTSVGTSALSSVASGTNNTAFGSYSLASNQGGYSNVAVGSYSQFSTLNASNNTSVGNMSMFSNITGVSNTVVGDGALFSSTGTHENVVVGAGALSSLTAGGYNTVSGTAAMANTVNGYGNTVMGYAAYLGNINGEYNTILGYYTATGVTNGTKNTIIGANITGLPTNLSNNIILADGDGNRRINVDANGNVGIGTFEQTARLEVANSTGPVVVAATLQGDPGTSDIFASYNFRAQSTALPSWTTAKSDTPDPDIYDFAYDPVNAVMYATGSGDDGNIYRCETVSGCDSNGDWAVAYTGAGTFDTVSWIAYNSNHGGELYAIDGKDIVKCSISSGCDANGDWSLVYSTTDGRLWPIVIDTANDVLYSGTMWTRGELVRCDIGATSCNEQSDFTVPYDPPSGEVLALHADTVNSTIYAVMFYTGLYRCETSTGCDDSGDWTFVIDFGTGNEEAQRLAQDTTNNILYASFGDTIWRCDLSSECDAAGDWTQSFDTDQMNVYSSVSLLYDSVHERMYGATGGNGYIYQCSTSTGCDAAGDWSISYDASDTTINAMGYDPVNGVVYAGAAGSGNIYRYNASAPPGVLDYGQISAQSLDNISGTEDGQINISVVADGTLKDVLVLNGTGATVNGSMSIQEGGSNPTFYTTFQGGDQTADITYTLPTVNDDGVLINENGQLRWGDLLGFYSNNSDALADGSYLDVVHNQDRNDLLSNGWFWDTISGSWKAIQERFSTIANSLSNTFNPDFTQKEKIGTVALNPAIDVALYGTGADGAITISADTNINTANSITGRSCADGGDAVNYSVSSLTSTTATLSTTPSTGCLAVGDEVLLINQQGIATAFANVGNYETLRIKSISTATITFERAKTQFYGNSVGSDSNIGTATTNQRVMLQRVPQYTNVTLANSGTDLTAAAWNGTKGGVLFFRATGTVTVPNGTTINTNASGYRGGTAGSSGVAAQGGEAFCAVAGVAGGSGGDSDDAPTDTVGVCGGGGGAGANQAGARVGSAGSASYGGAGGGGGNAGSTASAGYGYGAGGGGGGYGSAAPMATYNGNPDNRGAAGGTNQSGAGHDSWFVSPHASAGGGGGGGTYGDAALSKLYFGAGGGGGGRGDSAASTTDTAVAGGAGGAGGGIVMISAGTLSIDSTGSIQSNAANGSDAANTTYAGGGGGGAGGSIKVFASTVSSAATDRITAAAGTGSVTGTGQHGANGGVGRIAITAPSVTTNVAEPDYTAVEATGAFGIFVSEEIHTPGMLSSPLPQLKWTENLNTYGKVQIQTRTGNSPNSLEGSWEEWKPLISAGSKTTLNSFDTESQWIGNNATVVRTTDGFMAVASMSGSLVSVLPSNGDGTYSSKVDYAMGGNLYRVVAADVNGDGYKDLVTANYGNTSVSIRLNNGDNTFGARVDYATTNQPMSVAVGDLDGDGDNDIVATNYNLGTTASVFLNNGSGAFASKVDYTTGSSPLGVAIADLDGDRDADFVTVNSASNTVSVFKNNGNGTFVAKVDYATTTQGLGVTLSDFDGDSDIDMAVANSGSSAISVYINNGTGVFAAKVDYPSAASPRDIISADLDGDDDIDLAATNPSGNYVSVIKNNGNGTFAARVDYGTGTSAYGLGAADIDEDGDVDLAVTNYSALSASVLKNNGDGTFATKVDYTVGQSPTSLAVDTGMNSEDGQARDVNYFEDEDEDDGAGFLKLSTGNLTGYAETTSIPSTDMTQHDLVSAWVYANKPTHIKLGMGESAATEVEDTLYIDEASTWTKVYWDISDLTSASCTGGDGCNAVDNFRITLLEPNTTVYMDSLQAENYATISSAGSTITSTVGTYFQYRVILSSTNVVYNPVVSDFMLTYSDSSGSITADVNSVSYKNDPSVYESARIVTTQTDLDSTKSYRTATSLESITQRGDYDPGTGADGSITVTASKSINSGAPSIAGRTCADAPNYSVSGLTANTATLSQVPTSDCLVVGDEVLLINLQGTIGSVVNVGNYETLRVSAISGNTITFGTSKTKYYGEGVSDDSNLGIGATNQKVMLQRVPNYQNVTVSSAGALYPDVYDYTTGRGGVLFFRARGTVANAGTINADGKGNIGGIGTGTSSTGAAYPGQSIFYTTATDGQGGFGTAASPDKDGKNGTFSGGGGGGKYTTNTGGVGGLGSTYIGAGGGGAGGNVSRVSSSSGRGYGGGGGGGGYGTPGTAGYWQLGATSGSSTASGNGGTAIGSNIGGGGGGGASNYGESTLAKMFLGSGGGGGGYGQSYSTGTVYQGRDGGNGGGIVFIAANSISNAGNIKSSGENGDAIIASALEGGAGGGSGGTVKLVGSVLTLGNTVTVAGGTGSNSGGEPGGNGGEGRIAVYYSESITGAPSNANVAEVPAYNYAVYISDEIATKGATEYSKLRWLANLQTYGRVEFQTRSGKTNNSTDGSWEEWRTLVPPATNTVSLGNMNTHTDWTGTSATVAEGDITRNEDFYEDEDETTATNVTKITTTANPGYIEPTVDITATDISSADYITLWVRASAGGGNILKLGFGETAATQYEKTFNIDSADKWQKIYWDISGIDKTKRDAVTKLRVSILASGVTAYIDNIVADKFLSDSTGSTIASTPNDYIQYRAILSTSAIGGYFPTLHDIKIDWANGFKIVQIDANTVRLYNKSGETQKVRLDVVTQGVGTNQGRVSLAPSTATVDPLDNASSIWINKTGTGGELLKLQVGGVDVLNLASTGVMTLTGDFLPGGNDIYSIGSNTQRWKDVYIGGETLHIGTSITDEAVVSYDTTNNIFNFGTDSTTNGDIAFFGNDLYIDKSTGYVGVGTTLPGTALDVAGTVTVTGELLPGTDDTYSLGSDAKRWKDIFIGGETLHVGTSITDEALISYNTSTNILHFGTDGTTNGDIAFNSDDLYLDKSTGYVGIGKTNPASAFDISGDLRFSGSILAGSVPWSRLSGTQLVNGRVSMNNVGCGANWASACDANGNGYNDYSDALLSDARLKTVTGTLTNVLDKIKELRTVYYEWNDTYIGLGLPVHTEREIGLIAQEVGTIFPELVFTEGGTDDYYRMDYQKFSAVLLAGMQEQQSEIELLQSSMSEISASFSPTARFKDTTYARGTTPSIIEEGTFVGYSGGATVDGVAVKTVKYPIVQYSNQPGGDTYLGIIVGKENPDSLYDANVNPYMVARMGEEYLWVESGDGTAVTEGDDLNVSGIIDGYGVRTNGVGLATALESVDWNLVTDVVGERKVKRILVQVRNDAYDSVVASASQDDSFWVKENENSMRATSGIIASDITATRIDSNILRTRTLSVNDQFFIDDAGSVVANALSTPVIKGVAGGVEVQLTGEDAFKVTIDGNTMFEASVKGVKINNLTVSNEQAGKAVVGTGNSQMQVSSSLVKESSIVIVTPSKPMPVAVQTHDGYFTIELEVPPSQDVTVSWYIVNVAE